MNDDPPVLRALADLTLAPLTLVHISRLHQTWELRAGDTDVVGRLDRGIMGSALAETAGGRWKLLRPKNSSQASSVAVDEATQREVLNFSGTGDILKGVVDSVGQHYRQHWIGGYPTELDMYRDETHLLHTVRNVGLHPVTTVNMTAAGWSDPMGALLALLCAHDTLLS